MPSNVGIVAATGSTIASNISRNSTYSSCVLSVARIDGLSAWSNAVIATATLTANSYPGSMSEICSSMSPTGSSCNGPS